VKGVAGLDSVVTCVVVEVAAAAVAVAVMTVVVADAAAAAVESVVAVVVQALGHGSAVNSRRYCSLCDIEYYVSPTFYARTVRQF
jgi:hypothetical protein